MQLCLQANFSAPLKSILFRKVWIDFVDAYIDLCAVNTLPVDILASVYRWPIVACLDIGNNKLGALTIYPTLCSINLCNCFTSVIVKFYYIFCCYFYFDKWFHISTFRVRILYKSNGDAKQKSVSWKLKYIQDASAAQLEDLIVCIIPAPWGTGCAFLAASVLTSEWTNYWLWFSVRQKWLCMVNQCSLACLKLLLKWFQIECVLLCKHLQLWYGSQLIV